MADDYTTGWDGVEEAPETLDQEMDISVDRGPGILPEGTHRFLIQNVEVRPGREDPYLNVTCIVDEGSEFDGQMVWHIVSLGKKSQWKRDEFMDAVGAPDSGTVKPQWFEGHRFMGVIAHEVYDSKPRPRITTMAPLGSSTPTAPGKGVDFAALSAKRKPKTPAIPDDAVEE